MAHLCLGDHPENHIHHNPLQQVQRQLIVILTEVGVHMLRLLCLKNDPAEKIGYIVFANTLSKSTSGSSNIHEGPTD